MIPAKLREKIKGPDKKTTEHIQNHCEAWADWPKLGENEQQEVIEGYEYVYWKGVTAALELVLPLLREFYETCWCVSEAQERCSTCKKFKEVLGDE